MSKSNVIRPMLIDEHDSRNSSLGDILDIRILSPRIKHKNRQATVVEHKTGPIIMNQQSPNKQRKLVSSQFARKKESSSLGTEFDNVIGYS